MKRIKLQKMIEGPDTYKDFILMVLKNPLLEVGQGGTQAKPMTTDEVVAHYPIIMELSKIEVPEIGTVDFICEDADYKIILDRVNKWMWGQASESLFGFISAVRDAETVTLNDLKAESEAA